MNFRDMGGYSTHDGRTVRWRRLYRSDSLHWMTPNDITMAREKLTIALALDLRSANEVSQLGKGPLVNPAIGYHHFPLLDTPSFGEQDMVSTNPSDLDSFYIGILHREASQIATAMTTLSVEAAYPAVFYCAAGKDRTGLFAAVLLAALGVEDEQIIQDFLLTNNRISDVMQRLMTVPIYSAAMKNMPPELITAPREWMERLLDWVRSKHGSMRKYFEGQGVSGDVFIGLERNFLMK